MHAPSTPKTVGTQAVGLASSLDEAWAHAIAAGFHPVPIPAGSKAPSDRDWARRSTPLPTPPAGTVAMGLRCRPADRLLAIDVDCTCDILNRHERFPGLPIRWGRRPRFLVPFRPKDDIAGTTISLGCSPTCKLQIINTQFIAYGPHSVTLQPYVWDNSGLPWPELSRVELYALLNLAGVDATSVRAEPAAADFIESAEPRTDNERAHIRDAALSELQKLTKSLTGRPPKSGRGDEVFAATAHVAPAVHWGLLTREEIEDAVQSAGQPLTESGPGRTMGEEIMRGLSDPIRADNRMLNVSRDIRQFHAAVSSQMGAKTFGSIAARTYPPLKFAVEDILPQGCILLSARSRLGKSFLASEIAYSVAEGGSFWGHKCIQGNVLYFALEDDDHGLHLRNKDLRPHGSSGQDSIQCFTMDDQLPRISSQVGVPGFLELLDMKLAATPNTRLVVIDVLEEVRPEVRDKTKQPYQIDREALRGFRVLAGKYSVTILCVHHNNKSGGRDGNDVSEAISGTTGLLSASNGAWILTEHNGIITMTTRMKMIKDFEMVLTKRDDSPVLQPDDNSVLPSSAIRGHHGEIETRVLAAVAYAACEASVGDVGLRSGANPNTIGVYLRRMVQRGDLICSARGVYVLAGMSPKSRPEGARDMLLTAATGGTYADFQAGKMVNIREVLPHLARNDKVPVTEGYAVSLDVAKSLLSGFAEPDKLIKDMEGRKLAFVFDKVLLVPHNVAPVQVSIPPAAPAVISLAEAMRQQALSVPWGRFPWQL